VKALALLIVLAGSALAYAADLPQTAAEVSTRYLHVREATNRNDGPEVEMFLRYLGLPKGQPWCAAFSLYCYKEAADVLQVKQPFPRYGRVAIAVGYRAVETRSSIRQSPLIRSGSDQCGYGPETCRCGQTAQSATTISTDTPDWLLHPFPP